jgi:hypothetical protein
VILRTSNRSIVRQDDRCASRDEILAAADRTFGRFPDRIDDNVLVIGDWTFVYVAREEVPFVLRPSCAQCGTEALDQFPLEVTTIRGAQVRRTTRRTCRDCRFLALAWEEVEDQVHVAAPRPLRRRTRRYRHAERVGG